jgi:putative addiction module component (TIGR02574 family)
MGFEANDLMSQIESLPIDLKMALVEKILNGLHPSEGRIDDLWAEEVERRVLDIKSGEVKAIPGDEVFRAIQGRYAK